MATRDFTIAIIVDQDPEAVYHAINNVRGWWSEEITGDTDRKNGVFDYHYKDLHTCRIKVTELVPGSIVAWKVLDNQFKFTQSKTEWIGNPIVFEITDVGGQTRLQFTHVGLVPGIECYEICRDAWTNYITESLKTLIETGEGDPIRKTGNAFQEVIEERVDG
ncbi:SRPBCC family protein [Flavihumibacter petaseus]|uniref:Activator of Hsp90 ATPase homologue 1/2-like C-terminal domain-containing protein n=1 Tax=Flavihumibacter petaseus NBRC 106054 TaxID=1220578 RepID=A0A0E9N1N5_9BACT|nr:SRPBCC domain-containing protein [Flavihumibacter petaseus]GAO43541.1 hypothetical protein FPE01S_02_06460 [Flavihumibacter petaseus NBRC 106054]